MKEMLSKNLGLKLLALCISIFLWFIVISMEDPMDRREITDVPVTVVHPEVITNQGYTYRFSNESRLVSVTIKGKRSALNKIRREDIRAIADMKNLNYRSMIRVDVSVPAYAKYISEVTADPENIGVIIDAEKTKTFPITPLTSGSLRNGYVVGSLESDPERVEISGPESVVTAITKVVAEVDVTGLSKDTALDAKLVLYDGAGKIIDSTLIENNLGEEGVKVKVKVKHTKALPVTFDTSGIEPAEGYKFSGITVQPETVQIVGSQEQLASLTAIAVPAEALAEKGLTKSMERTVDIAKYLPEWAKPEDETAGLPVLVSIQIEKYGTKTLQVSAGTISLINVPKGFTAHCETTGNIEILAVSVHADLLDQLVLEPGDVSVNLVSFKEEGIYDVKLQVKLPDGVELEEPVTVKVKLERESKTEE